MNRRGFVGTALAGIGGLLFPQKLKAEEYVSLNELFCKIKSANFSLRIFAQHGRFYHIDRTLGCAFRIQGTHFQRIQTYQLRRVYKNGESDGEAWCPVGGHWGEGGWISDGTEPIVFDLDMNSKKITHLVLYNSDTHITYRHTSSGWYLESLTAGENDDSLFA